jgi:hypothetical protein
VAVFAVSYDPVPVLAGFAAKRGITYDLLSDEGSRVIRDLGLLNTHLEEQHAHYGVRTREEMQGVSYPGAFTLDERGVVVEKRFEQSYRVRPTAGSLLETVLRGETSRAVQARATTRAIEISAWLDSATYRPYQQLRLYVDIAIQPGLHVYATPAAEGLTPLSIDLEPLESLDVSPVELPEPRLLSVEGTGETYRAYERHVRGILRFGLLKNLGEISFTVRVSYQACSDRICYRPDRVSLTLPLRGLDNIRD